MIDPVRHLRGMRGLDLAVGIVLTPFFIPVWIFNGLTWPIRHWLLYPYLVRRFEKKCARQWREQHEAHRRLMQTPEWRERMAALRAANITRCTECQERVQFIKDAGEKYRGKWFHLHDDSRMCEGANPQAVLA